MIKYNTDKSFTDNMDALLKVIEDKRKEYLRLDEDEEGNRLCEQEDTDRWMVEILEHVKDGIFAAQGMYPLKPIEAVCEVANVLSISLGDSLRTGYASRDTRCEVFGKDDLCGMSSMVKYIKDMVDSSGEDHIMTAARRCTSCGQEYLFWFPRAWNDGRDASAVKKATRAFNTNSSYEFMCLSGMCDACWQKHYNKKPA